MAKKKKEVPSVRRQNEKKINSLIKTRVKAGVDEEFINRAMGGKSVQQLAYNKTTFENFKKELQKQTRLYKTAEKYANITQQKAKEKREELLNHISPSERKEMKEILEGGIMRLENNKTIHSDGTLADENFKEHYLSVDPVDIHKEHKAMMESIDDFTIDDLLGESKLEGMLDELIKDGKIYSSFKAHAMEEYYELGTSQKFMLAKMLDSLDNTLACDRIKSYEFHISYGKEILKRIQNVSGKRVRRII